MDNKLKEAGLLMSENKEKKLMDMMSTAYDDTEVTKCPDLMELLLKSATELNNEEPYIKVVTQLGRGISDHYMKNGRNLPNVMTAIYHFIQPDMKEGSINNAALRQKAIGYGIASMPAMFGFFSN
ncbi:hypothetical protein LFYK43_11380 [Ligilactobacillus salitolerans]|uniref:Bacteriocin immunity protein n=1 Tax=Ligilactobacillus salitolerans TaxID=1808352 RepID=A0A401IT34_9LACO|nr:bacteriocin immunity protein [Ligilactobacillus salitolerans]GBG94679.1 hypothetical protein LFYK43_11380 [Ligilactobacillus salitolerans]